MILLFTLGSLYTVQLWQIGPKKWLKQINQLIYQILKNSIVKISFIWVDANSVKTLQNVCFCFY